MAERITIIVSGGGNNGLLTVQDAMQQVLDSIELLTASAVDDARPKLRWRLVSATMNSPFKTVAEAVSANPTEWPDIDLDAHQAKMRYDELLSAVLEYRALPDWTTSSTMKRLKALLERNVNGVSQTDVVLLDNKPPLKLVTDRAEAALEVISHSEFAAEHWPSKNLGSIEGNVIETIKHYGKPAFKLLHRISGEKILCVIPNDRVEQIGTEHNWGEVWTDQRCIVSGTIERKATGKIAQLTVDEIHPVTVGEVDIDNIADPTGGQSPQRHLADLWGE